jgi:catechol 2,3-dioxygenase-like lactoylglutathione lyase family enzyme
MNRIALSLIVSGILATVGNHYFNHKKEKSMKLNAGVITTKLAETKKFYQEVLGFEIRFESDWFILLNAPGGKDEIAFLLPDHPSQAKIFQPAFGGRGVFLTIEVDDVDTEYKRIREMKIPVEVELRDEQWGDRHFAIVDPNGIGVDVVTHTAK